MNTQVRAHLTIQYNTNKQPVQFPVIVPSGACSTANRSNRPDHWDVLMLDSYWTTFIVIQWNKMAVIAGRRHTRLPAIAAILFYWITMKVVQQLTCLTIYRPSQRSGIFHRWAVEHAPELLCVISTTIAIQRNGWPKMWSRYNRSDLSNAITNSDDFY